MNDIFRPLGAARAQLELLNPKLADREIVFDYTEKNFKIGDGIHYWNELEYFLEGTFASKSSFTKGDVGAAPRMRISRSQSLTLSNNWQRVDFNGSSASNTNTFSVMTGTAKMVSWDVPNRLIKFNDTADRTFNYSFFYTITNGVRPVNILYRFVIPSPTPFYFPFPDEANPYGRLEDITSIVEVRESKSGVLYTNEAMRQYGLGLELKVGSPNIITGILPPTLSNAAFLIYAR